MSAPDAAKFSSPVTQHFKVCVNAQLEIQTSVLPSSGNRHWEKFTVWDECGAWVLIAIKSLQWRCLRNCAELKPETTSPKVDLSGDSHRGLWEYNNVCLSRYTYCYYSVLVKVEQSHRTSMEAQGERMCSSYSFTNSILDRVSGQRHAPAALYPWGKDPRYP
jgi:hypothetical protein